MCLCVYEKYGGRSRPEAAGLSLSWPVCFTHDFTSFSGIEFNIQKLQMMKTRNLLPPDSVKGWHDIRGMTIRGSIIEIGKGQYQDFISESVLEDCEIRIFCGASHVNISRTTLKNCEIRPKKEMKNLRLTDVNIDGCVFHGRYTGLRLGTEEPECSVSIKNCDFTSAKAHLTEFLPGVGHREHGTTSLAAHCCD